MGDGGGSSRSGLFYGIAAYGLWGVMPIYFRAVDGVSPEELLAHRIVWCFLLLVATLTAFRRWGEFLAIFRRPRTLLLLVVSAHLVAANWLIYIYGVSNKDVVQTTLGYFINPLFSVLLGLVVFRERLRPPQWLAIALATAGVGFFIAMVAGFPWIALGVAFSFGLYGLVRKMTPVDGLIGLTVESLVLTPVAASCLIWWGENGALKFGTETRTLDVLLLASGAITALPLICFGQAARRLPLSTLGFLQYMAPTLQFFIAVLLFHESFMWEKQVSFALVWLALIVLTVDSVLHSRRPPSRVEESRPAAVEQPRAIACTD